MRFPKWRVPCVAAVLLTCVPAVFADDWLDMRQTMLARQTLLSDRQLGPLNLGVRVRDGVAFLWGPVPSREAAERAVACLQKLPQLRAVRSELFLDPLTERAGLMPTVASKPQSPPPPSILTTAQPTPAPPWLPVAQTTVQPPPPVVVETPSHAPDLLDAVRQLQQGEERFRRIILQVDGEIVYLGGVAQRWQDIHELSRAIARIPGVERVVLRGIRSER